MNTMPLEADTRVLIDTNLKNLGWHLSGKEQNVFFERAKTENEQKKLGGKRPDYVLYSKDSDKPLVVIEAKKKGERIDAALEQGIFYAKQLDAPLVYATDGVFCKSFHTLGNTVPKLNGEDIDEFIREALALKFLASWEVNTVSPKVQYDRKELIKIFDEANNMLRGDGLRAGIERFGEFANILFLKLISENEHNRIDYSCSWDAIKSIPPTTRIDYINSTVYQRLNNLYGTDIFTPLTIRDNVILKEIMDKLDPLTLTDVDSDVKGDAFEYFLKESTSTKNDLGEYFTPRHIVKTMVRLVNPQIGERVYDPFCGTGGFLIETFRHIYNNMPRNAKTEKMLREDTIYGNEITNTARITKMNMILAGDGHSNIHMKDSLANPVDGEYDVVLANMPYSQKTKHGNLYDLPSTNGDSICVQHCMKAISSLSENGRMALVVPEGFLFRKELTKMREFMLENCQLQSIISLPQGVFLPYTGVKTNIIYATKVNQKLKSTEKRKDFWYFDVKSDGYTLDSHRRKLSTSNDLTKYEEYRKLDNDPQKDVRQELRGELLQVGFESVSLDKVRENSFVLVRSRYREQATNNSAYNFVELSHLCDIISGYAFKSSDLSKSQSEGFFPVVKIGNLSIQGTLDLSKIEYHAFQQSLEKYMVEKDDVLIAMTGATVGKVSISNFSNLLLNQRVANIKPNTELLNKKYLYYLLTSERFYSYCQESAGGVAQGNISANDIGNFQIPLPSLDVQQQIVDEVENYKRIVNGAKEIVDSYKPIIPQSTQGQLKALEDIAIFKPSKDEVKELEKGMLVSFVPMADMNSHNKSFVAKEERTLDEVYSGFTYFGEDDVLLAKITPCFENGKAGIASNLKNGIGFGSTEYIVIRANKELVYPEWIYYHINSSEFLRQGKGFMTGTAGQQRIDINFVKGFSISVPSLAEQRRILDDIQAEQILIEQSRKLVEVFIKKIQCRISEIWGG